MILWSVNAVKNEIHRFEQNGTLWILTQILRTAASKYISMRISVHQLKLMFHRSWRSMALLNSNLIIVFLHSFIILRVCFVPECLVDWWIDSSTVEYIMLWVKFIFMCILLKSTSISCTCTLPMERPWDYVHIATRNKYYESKYYVEF